MVQSDEIAQRVKLGSYIRMVL